MVGNRNIQTNKLGTVVGRKRQVEPAHSVHKALRTTVVCQDPVREVLKVLCVREGIERPINRGSYSRKSFLAVLAELLSKVRAPSACLFGPLKQ